MKWDLSYLFETEDAFEASLNNINSYVEKMASLQGKLEDEDNFVTLLLVQRDFEEAANRIYEYASLSSDLNKKDTTKAARLNRTQMAFYSAQSALAFIEPEIISLGKDKVLSIINKHDEIKEFKFIMEKLFDQNDHILSKKEENLLANYVPLSSEGASLFSMLSVADGKSVEVVLENNEKVAVNNGNWTSLVESAKTEEDRKKIFEAVFGTIEKNKNTYAEIYKTVLASSLASALSRNYNSSLEAHLDRNKIPTAVYYNLVDVAGNNNQSLKKYIKLREKALNLSSYHTYDRFISLASSDKKYSYEDAKKMFFASVDKFPDEFKDKAHEALRDGFVDVYQQDGKRTGAYSSGLANLHPFILLNHDGTLDSCFTVAHEAGHSMHTLFSEEAQPTMLQNYTIFVAEIASTFNEHNLLDYILNSSNATKEEKIIVIQKAIDSIVSTFYRQTLFAEFEMEAHKLYASNAPINHEVLSKIMIDLYQKYYGIDITKEIYKQYVWAYIPHMYYTPFYVYQYATSFAASFKLYKDVRDNKEGAMDNYMDLLKSGGSKYPMEQTKEAGVDFTKKETFMAVVERMDELVKELEELLK